MAKDKKSFVLRINGETMSALEKWAADEFRSVNGQLEYIITDALRKAGAEEVSTVCIDEMEFDFVE